MIWLVNYVAMLLVVCQLSRDVIGYETRNEIGAFRSSILNLGEREN